MFVHVLAVYAFHSVSISFWASCSFLTAKPDTSFCLHCKHSPQHRTASVVSFLSIPQAPLIQSVTTQALFQPTTSGMFYFLRRVCPNERILLVLIRIGFFFQKDSKNKSQKDKYNKDFLSIIFTDKKIKNLAKIRRPTQTHALGSKGRCPSGFEKKSPHFRKLQVVFLPKTLTAQSVRLIRWLYFLFFLLLFFFLFSGGKNYLRAQQLLLVFTI